MKTEVAAAEAVADEASPEASDALVAKVEAGLAALSFGDDELPETEEAEAAAEAASTPEGKADEGDEAAGDEAQSDEDKGDEDDQAEDEAADEEAAAAAKPAGKTSETSTLLPDAHRRSLKAYGWDDEAIDANLKSNSSQFIETAQRLHSNRVRESQQWAALGRQAHQQPVERSGDEGAAYAAAQSSKTVTAQLKAIDADALRKKYGDDLPVDEIVGPVNEAIKAVNAVLPQITSSVQAIRRTEQQALENTVDEFFKSSAVKGYDAVYGTSTEQCSEDQYQNRNLVLENADAIMVGASRQGRRMGIQEALELAHAGIAHEFTKTAIRSDIKAKVKSRNRSLTVKPTKGGKSLGAPAGKPKSAADLERRTAQRLREVFAKS